MEYKVNRIRSKTFEDKTNCETIVHIFLIILFKIDVKAILNGN